MRAGDERAFLAGLPDRLCADLDFPLHDGAAAPPPSDQSSIRFGAPFGPEEEELIATARCSLRRIMVAVETKHPPAVSRTVTGAITDGAESVMRAELAKGNRPSELMPSFVFLAVLPMLSRDQALELSRRTASILEEAPS